MRAHVSRSPAGPSSPCVCGGIPTRSPPGTASSAEFADSDARPSMVECDGDPACAMSDSGGRRSSDADAGTTSSCVGIAPASGAGGCATHPASAIETIRKGTGSDARAPASGRQQGSIRMRDATYSGVPVPGVMCRSGGCAERTQCYGEAPARSRTPRRTLCKDSAQMTVAPRQQMRFAS